MRVHSFWLDCTRLTHRPIRNIGQLSLALFRQKDHITRMLEYEIIVSSNRIALVDKMKAYLSNNWKPIGGPVVVEHEKEIWQAITREAKVPVGRSDHRKYTIDPNDSKPVAIDEDEYIDQSLIGESINEYADAIMDEHIGGFSPDLAKEITNSGKSYIDRLKKSIGIDHVTLDPNENR